MSSCIVAGAWDNVTGVNLTKQEWQARHLSILCQTIAAYEGVPVSSCSVAGVWDQVSGSGYMTDAQFYATSISTMCSLLNAIVANPPGGGGGGPGGVTFTFGNGNPPIDGSVLTQGYFDLNGSLGYLNVAWPITANPNWTAL